jgi:hypothetical protein
MMTAARDAKRIIFFINVQFDDVTVKKRLKGTKNKLNIKF